MKKITKNVISRKLQGFEQSYLLARFVTPQSNLTALNYKVENFKFWNLILKKSYKFSKNFSKKLQKTYLENYKDLSSHILRRDSRSLIVLWQYPSTGLGISDFLKKINNLSFLKTFEKIYKKHHISKTTKNWAVIVGGKIRNLWDYSDRTQLMGWEFQIFKRLAILWNS